MLNIDIDENFIIGKERRINVNVEVYKTIYLKQIALKFESVANSKTISHKHVIRDVRMKQ